MYTVKELHESLATLIVEGLGDYEVKCCDTFFFGVESLWVRHKDEKRIKYDSKNINMVVLDSEA